MISPDALAACMLALRMSIEHCKQAHEDFEKRAVKLLQEGDTCRAFDAYSRALAHDEFKDDFTFALSEIQNYIKEGGV